MTPEAMLLNRLLTRQIKKHLPAELWSDERLIRFIEAVNDSYHAFEKDKTLADHAFRLNEEEYVRINTKLQAEVQGRRQAIKTLKEAIARMDEGPDGGGVSGGLDGHVATGGLDGHAVNGGRDGRAIGDGL